MNFKNSNNDSSTSHNESIISQFTKQAIPFTKLSEHSNEYGLELMFELAKPMKRRYSIGCCMWTRNSGM